LTGLFGLSNAAERKPNFVRPMLPPSEANGGLNPSDLSQIYHGAALHNAGYYGGGETIAIFSPTGYNQSDINNFLSANDITGANISIVNVNGGATDFSSEEEACLDIETVVGQASAATIKVYEGPNDGSLDIFNQMASDDPNIVTESYGADENSVTASFAASYETLRSQMAAEGISILVASGDNGAYDSSYQSTVTTSVDATSAYVTSVGGTELQPYIGDIWNGEIAWTYNDGTLGTNAGSGGGLSIYYAQPSWQTGPGVANGSSNGMRQIPDISSLASTPYYSIYALGAFAAYGGTSAACQFTGGTLALIEEQLGGGRLGNIDPALYGSGNNDAAIYHDITSGNNGIYSCTPNWDFVTGWGSVDFAKLALGMLGTNISSSPVTTFGSGLQMFSVPFTFSNGATPAELLSGMVTSAGYPAYSVAVWKPTADTYELSPSSPANSIVPGQGYWARFDSSSGGALPAIGTPVTVATYSVSLASGWNMIGNPYLTSVPINSLQVTSNGVSNSFSAAVTAGVLQPILYDYNGTIYVAHTSGDSLNPYDGYWIDSNEACTLTFSSP
jgi:kumamolisin